MDVQREHNNFVVITLVSLKLFVGFYNNVMWNLQDSLRGEPKNLSRRNNFHCQARGRHVIKYDYKLL